MGWQRWPLYSDLGVVTMKGNDESLNQVRRIAIDILQAGNYLERGHKTRALENMAETIKSMRKLLKLINKGA